MTANSIKGVSPIGEFPGRVNGVSSATEGDKGFSDLLKSSTGKQANGTAESIKGAETARVKEPVRQEAPETKAADADAATEDIRTEAGEPVEKDVTATEETGEAGEVRAEEEAAVDEIPQEVEEAAAELMGIISQTLDIPLEQVTEKLEEMGIEPIELLNPDNIPQVVVELTGNQDLTALVTDEQLLEDVNLLKAEAEDLMDQLSQELEIPVENLEQQIKTFAESMKEAAEALPVMEMEPEETREAPVITGDRQESSPTADAAMPGAGEAIADRVETLQTNQSQRGNSNRESHQGEAQGQFTQTVTQQLRETVLNKTEDVPFTYSAGEDNRIFEQITEGIKVSLKEDITEMELQLHPASLGNVRVQVAARDGVITAGFITQNEQVRAALEAQVVQLKEQMNEQGLKVDAIEVTVASHAFDSNLSREGDRDTREGEQAEEMRTAGRRRRSIMLNGSMDAEEEELSEEDKVVADMMARSGNSVDYMA